MKWLNFGGGHHITREDYDIEKLVKCINYIKEKYDVEVYLEPGEAVALNTGFLVSEVLDITKNEMDILLMDTSASCHMPDVIEMPYRPFIFGSGMPNEKKYTYRLGGPTCLAGDVIGDYSFDNPVKVGDKLIFTDMAHYSMVKTNTFNGINLPVIAVYTEKGGVKVIRKFEKQFYQKYRVNDNDILITAIRPQGDTYHNVIKGIYNNEPNKQEYIIDLDSILLSLFNQLNSML